MALLSVASYLMVGKMKSTNWQLPVAMLVILMSVLGSSLVHLSVGVRVASYATTKASPKSSLT